MLSILIILVIFEFIVSLKLATSYDHLEVIDFVVIVGTNAKAILREF